ncbi:cytochrome c biogenesis protein/redoxin [Terrisporobacter sp.]|uniref:cytochrome c biogenesis protein/redoxin n=1 Tax=Terrisporobacter sp. TaxID=1965305 RepID=UPI002604F7F9|nr:cytochrome c biogenesis protein/redoxin [Terrisporobacter sp.]
MEKISLLVVFVEGLLSFLSPCVLPILPVYLSVLSNSSVDILNKNKNNFIKSSLFRNTIFFVLGISTTFFILGTSASIFSNFISSNKDIISFIGGIIIIIMGLFYVDILKSSILNREKRFNFEVKNVNIFTAYLLGFTFSFGWTPCIGPVLASVLLMVSSSNSIMSGNILIGVYTLGFILPFIIATMFYGKLIGSINKLKSNIDTIKKIGGIILIISGMTMLISGFDGVRAHLYGANKAEIQSEESKDEEKDKVESIDFTLYDQYGKEHKLSDYKGKTVFLNFWATWCPPCKSEMPHIEEIYKEYGKNNEDVVVIGVASPNLGKEVSKEEIIEFLEKNNYTFPVLFDESGMVMYQYGINSYPSTFIIDKEGYVTQYVPGALDKDTMKYLIELDN